MNMRSGTPASDLSTRARIRNSAVELFGAHGFDRTSIRMIADAAGVSPAAVLHHFGDKLSLRRECDTHVLRAFTEDADLAGSPTVASIQAALADADAYGPALDYLARMLADDSDAADVLFDGLMDGTLRMLDEQRQAGIVRSASDPEGTALLLTVFGLAPLVLARQFARRLGETRLTPAALLRITMPTVELLTHGVYRDDTLLRVTRASLGLSEPEPEPEPEPAADDRSDEEDDHAGD